MLVDAHVHIGSSFWGNFTPEFLLDIIGDNVGICSNLAGIDSYTQKDEYAANMEMITASKKYRQIKPLYVCQPERSLDTNILKYMLREYADFIGLKFHPEFTKLPANSEKYDKYLKVAQDFKKPCLFHSGHIKSKFSSPDLIYEKAKQFPDVPVILGHLSTGIEYSKDAALEIMLESIEQNTATLYADVSWVEPDYVIKMVEKLQNTLKGDYSSRIMWASDAPVGEVNQKKDLYNKTLNLFKVKILEHFQDENLLKSLLCNNARNLFGI